MLSLLIWLHCQSALAKQSYLQTLLKWINACPMEIANRGITTTLEENDWS